MESVSIFVLVISGWMLETSLGFSADFPKRNVRNDENVNDACQSNATNARNVRT